MWGDLESLQHKRMATFQMQRIQKAPLPAADAASLTFFFLNLSDWQTRGVFLFFLFAAVLQSTTQWAASVTAGNK